MWLVVTLWDNAHLLFTSTTCNLLKSNFFVSLSHQLLIERIMPWPLGSELLVPQKS